MSEPNEATRAMWDTIAQDDDELAAFRERLQRERGESFVNCQTRYLFAGPPLTPVAAVAVGNHRDWAAYVAGTPWRVDADMWWAIYTAGAKLPEDVARAWFPGFAYQEYRR